MLHLRWEPALLALVLMLTTALIVTQWRTERAIRRQLGIPSPQLGELGYRLRRAEAERGELEQQVGSLRDRVAALRAIAVAGEDGLRTLGQEVDRLRVLAGFTILRGPGVVLEIRDSTRTLGASEDANDVLVHYTDLQALVNEMWAAGAEAVAINGERFTTASSIKCVGTTVLVNQRRMTSPFRLEAVGDPASLEAYLLRADGAVASLRAFGFPVPVNRSERLVLPAYRGPVAALARATH